MIIPGWTVWCLLLTLHMSACNLEASGYNSHEVICSQGLSNCTMKDEIPLFKEENTSVNVQNLTPYFKLCCKDGASCWLCLVIDMEINTHTEKDMEDEGHSGRDEEEYNEELSNSKASVSVCFKTAHTMPSCKRVEFTVNHAALTQQHQAKVSMVITEPAGVTFSSQLRIYSVKHHLFHPIVAPSLDEVCSQNLSERVEECGVPRLLSVINEEKNRVELQFVGRNMNSPSVCLQYEQNGKCKRWKRLPIPLYSVTTCMCFQVWDEDDQRSRRSLSCPFINTNLLHRNIWENISVSVGQGQMSNSRSMLSWNVSAPCRLEGEVWPCQRDLSCREVKGFRQQLATGEWRQNSKELWVTRGVFEDINLQLSPCVMVKVRGMGLDLGPFCFNNTDRWRWSLLVVGVMLIVCLTMIMFYVLHDFIKKWVWSCHYGGFVKVGRMSHVVLLSPPDVDAGVSESVCELGSLLSNHGFHVSVDQWSRKEQCTLGPLPWLHSQLLELKSQGGRVVLVLTHDALERTEEWTRLHKEDIKMKVDNNDLPQTCSPYSDVFTASLCIIQADKQQGRAGERFLLVKFDSHPSSDRRLPELFKGLPLFHLPSKIQALLSELTVGAQKGEQDGHNHGEMKGEMKGLRWMKKTQN
ncbi:interleukin-17 receptor C isoform X2 [Labrus mixtus]|uniref:interleukin-17 receptor C isoform X2 n=1 Tax=Labrus mixtus TaxID=508554 RepID=UPI0029C03F5B|nr:interleukin-17 receptor C isoform X2 [Labrus mixtus]